MMEVRIEKILAGNVPDETVFCYFLNTQDFGGSKEKEYELEKKYLFLMDKTSSLFYPHDKYHAPSDYCLNLSDNIYRHMGEKLAFDNEDEICQYVQNRLSSQTAEKDLDRINGKWSDSEYIAVIQLKDILHKASSEFSGTCYIAEVLTVESGNEKDIVRSDGQLIQVTLEDAKTEVGKTYRAGFSLKGGATSVYTQEGFETIEEIKDGSPL